VIWLLALVVLALLLFFGLGRTLTGRRTRAWRRWAESRGLDFAAGPERRIGITYLEIPLLGSGRAVARNLAAGQWHGHEVHAFDVVVGPEAESASGTASRYTCVLVAAGLPLIPLCVRPREADLRAAAELGPEPITVGGGDFGEAYEVTAAEERWARQILHPELVARLLAGPRWRLELGGWSCLVAAPGRLEVERLDAALELAVGVLATISPAVRREILGEAADEPSGD
jgi:hypothetical protein